MIWNANWQLIHVFLLWLNFRIRCVYYSLLLLKNWNWNCISVFKLWSTLLAYTLIFLYHTFILGILHCRSCHMGYYASLYSSLEHILYYCWFHKLPKNVYWHFLVLRSTWCFRSSWLTQISTILALLSGVVCSVCSQWDRPSFGSWPRPFLCPRYIDLLRLLSPTL